MYTSVHGEQEVHPMSEQQPPMSAQDRPVPAGYQTWRDYWNAQGTPWRLEPEIDKERQQELDRRRREIAPDIEHSKYPVKNIEPSLSRADIEWLLATHNTGGMQGPIEWEDVSQRNRDGLDLRGVILHQISLNGLPLAQVKGGLSGEEFNLATPDQRMLAALVMTGGSLRYTHLEGAKLNYAQLEGVSMFEAHLEAAELYGSLLTDKLPADLGHVYFDYRTRLDRI
jgi:uncharacterized protein YjbI with pentapeptide repeats